jgi:putative ABC transport system ATP-binding protein/lipoprotein-releasing system ATP-binding protein
MSQRQPWSAAWPHRAPSTAGERNAVAVRLAGVRHSLGGRVILDFVDLMIPSATSLAVTGPSGSGKTTLLHLIAGLMIPDQGRVEVADAPISQLKPAARAAVRLRSIGVVYQFGELLAELNALENVTLPALLAGRNRAWAYERAFKLMTDLGIERIANQPAGLLSGGERQRVAVARALATEPAVILADEPTGSLDTESTDAVAELLYELPSRHGCAVVVVTHDERVARGADHRVDLVDGKLKAPRS